MTSLYPAAAKLPAPVGGGGMVPSIGLHVETTDRGLGAGTK